MQSLQTASKRYKYDASNKQTASKRYKNDVSAYCSEDQMQFTTAIFVPGVHYEVHLIAVTHEHAILETVALA